MKHYISDLDYSSEETRAVLDVLNRRWLTMGPLTEKFEHAFARRLPMRSCVLVSSGTAALHLALHTLGVGRGDEVIVPSLTFVATANVVIQCGARCVFADIESVTMPLVSPNDVGKKISPRTRVILPVHYAGFSANMEALKKIAEKERKRRNKTGEKRPLYIVEDAAHAVGAKDKNGIPLGTIGDVGCFSLFSNKNIATGEGGIVTSQHEEIIKRIRLIRSHGLTRQTWERHKKETTEKRVLYDMKEPGFNYRPTEITAALGIEQLKKLSRFNKKRETIFHHAQKKLEKSGEIWLPFYGAINRGKPSYHILPILLKNEEKREETKTRLNNAGIQTSHHYRPVHTMYYYKKKYPGTGKELKKTEEYAQRELTLPLHSKLTKSNMNFIINVLKKEL